MRTLKASLIASAIGTVAWLSGVTSFIWPDHPQWAVLFLTLGVTFLLMLILPQAQRGR